ncbi:MAG: hypothetical protein GY853_03415 [PVC group bacterium]|nr:hypothetical protein [PVC group bacterium]
MIKKILLSILILWIIVIISGFIYLNKVYIPQKLKPLVIENVEKALDKKMTIDHAQYYPMKGVSFSGINIVNQDDSQFIAVKSASLKLRSFPKISKDKVVVNAKLIVDQAYVQQDQILVEVEGMALDINANVKGKEDVSLKGNLSLKGINLKGLPAIQDIMTLKGTIDFTQDSFNSNDLSLQINKEPMTLAVNGTFSPEDLNIAKFSAVYGKTNLDCSAKVFELKNPQLDATISGAIDLESIGKILKDITLPIMSGVCNFTFKADGSAGDLSALKAKGNINFPQGEIEKIKFSQLTADILLEKGIVYCNPFKCVFYEGRIDGNAEAGIIDVLLPIKCAIDIDGINIEPLITDVAGYDVGGGKLAAHAAISGSATDLNSLDGTGWFKLTEAKVQIPSKFEKLATMFQLNQLSSMLINEASASFTIAEGKIDTQDLQILADLATFTAKGYATFTQYIDFIIEISVAESFKDSFAGNITSFIRKVQVHGQGPNGIKYKPLIEESVKAAVVEQVKEKGLDALKGLLGGGDNSGGAEGSEQPQGDGDIKDQIKKGLEGLFGR